MTKRPSNGNDEFKEPQTTPDQRDNSTNTAAGDSSPITPMAETPIIVGIGASAGGLSALNELLENLPIDTGMAFVVVQHMGAESPTLLPELLSRKTKMVVTKITASNMAVQPNHVYVIMPGSHLGIIHGKLQLLESDAPLNFTIDHFFSALACDQGARAVGVILSGSGSDGSIGLKEINAKGGITFAQSEDTAAFSVMPHHAIASGCVDYILSPTEIAKQLTIFARDLTVRRTSDDALKMADENLNKIFFLLRQQTGHDFSRYKQSTLQRRIRRRMGIHHIRTLDDYVKHLQSNRAEIDKLFDDILINVTSFFRDPDLFDSLRKDIFPVMLKDRPVKEAIRIWVPGCSTGEEPYSLAMTLMEFFGDRWADRPVQIFATDIDSKALAKARAGIYGESSLSAISLVRRKNFFNKVPGGYQISKSIRDWCVFAEQDVLKDPPFSRLDMICCRNLLIYMDNGLQKHVLSIFHFALRTNGILVLGSSETTSQGSDWFLTVDNKRKVYSKKNTHLKPKYEFEGVTSTVHQDTPKLSGAGTATRNVQKEAEHYLLYHYGPPSIIIDNHFDIVGFLGNTAPFIEPAPGAVSLKLLKMVHRDLVMELRALIHSAIKDNLLAKRDNILCRINQEDKSINLKVVPLQGGDSGDRYFMVIFEFNSTANQVIAPVLKIADNTTPSEKDERIRELERQLGSIRDEMQGIIGEQLSTNEELQTANEEIQSANEELQSTNEELESAKEELQSTNEELATVNDELESRNEELAQLNNDLSNLLNSINLPMLMLSGDLRIRQFTPGAKPLLNIIDSDIGRPITNIRSNIDIPDMERIILDVIAHATPHTLEAKDVNGFVYSINVRPYKTSDQRIAGAVLVFINISDIRINPQQTRWLSALTKDSGEALSLIDTKGNFLAWNSVAEKLYGFTESEALRMNIMDMIPPSSKNDVEDMMRRVLAKESVNAFESVRIAKNGNRVDVLMAATGMYDRNGHIYSIAISEGDFTRQRAEFEKALKILSLFDESDTAVIAFDLQGKITLWNHKANITYGYSDHEFTGMNFRALLPAELSSNFTAWVDTIATGKTLELQKAPRIANNGKQFTVNYCAIHSAGNDKPGRVLLFEHIESEA